ncbi:uncharacterized protein BO66DRAFT_389396, partial [Aspergillus aculeatinus CBS 121060]
MESDQSAGQHALSFIVIVIVIVIGTVDLCGSGRGCMLRVSPKGTAREESLPLIV